MGYELLVGLRYLFSRKGDFLVSIITVISIVGVALGVTSLLVVLAVVTGFEQDFRNKILGNNSHIIVVEAGKRTMSDYEELVETIDEVDDVKGASPFFYEEVLLRGKSDRSSGVLLYGVDPARIGDVTSIESDMLVGDIRDLQTESDLPGIIVGAEIANHTLFLVPGDTVDVVSPSGEVSPFGISPKIRRFRVVGIFKSGLYEYDSRTAYIDLKQAQRFFGVNEQISGIQVSTTNINAVSSIAKKISSVVGSRYFVRTWMELNRDLFSAFKLEKTVFFIVLTMIILVAAFNIVGTLIIVVTEKSREIAILKALGAKSSSIMKIFMSTGCIIGFIGTILGIVAGFVLILLLRDYIQFPLNANVYQVDNLPVSLNPYDFIMVALAAFLISCISTLYPSFKAAQLKPAEGLRYE